MGNTSSADGRRSSRANSTGGAAPPARPPARPQAGYPGAGAPPGAGGYPGAGSQGNVNLGQMRSMFLEGMRPEMAYLNFPALPASAHQAPQMQKTYTIRNDVNLKKNTLRLVRDAAEPSKYHVEFTFDASTPCKISVHYAALELAGDGAASFSPLKPEASPPTEFREKGLSQTYRTPASHALDTAAYTPEELRFEPTAGRYPLIVCLEAGGREPAPSKAAVQSQTTFAKVVVPAGGAAATAKPLKQKIQVGSTAYELQEIYGIDGSGGGAADDEGGADGGESSENTRECVICMSEPRDTTVLPCRHMCMCSECAKVLRLQSNKCPICRTSIESLLQIKISKQNDAGAPSGAAAAAPAAPTDAAAPAAAAPAAAAPPAVQPPPEDPKAEATAVEGSSGSAGAGSSTDAA